MSKIARSTGNVFRDLGLPPTEATRLLIRADLLIEIQRVVKARRLTGQALAKTLALSRDRVNELRRGRLRRFSTDALIDMPRTAAPVARSERYDALDL